MPPPRCAVVSFNIIHREGREAMNKMLTCVFAMFIFVSGGAMLARAEQDVHGFCALLK